MGGAHTDTLYSSVLKPQMMNTAVTVTHVLSDYDEQKAYSFNTYVW